MLKIYILNKINPSLYDKIVFIKYNKQTRRKNKDVSNFF